MNVIEQKSSDKAALEQVWTLFRRLESEKRFGGDTAELIGYGLSALGVALDVPHRVYSPMQVVRRRERKGDGTEY